MKIATWNVNSLRVRLPHVLSWLKDHQPHLLAIQETKLINELFPQDEINQAGYHSVFNGQPGFNGVAILSKNKGTDLITDIPNLTDPQRRIIGVTVDDIRIINLYVPNGESVFSNKFQYKLDWLSKLIAFLTEELIRYPKMIILGDFNIAPEKEDVHDPVALEEQVIFSKMERELFKKILDLGFKDSFRLFPQTERAFSWWDYRMNSFKRNCGLRIDHILVSLPLVQACKTCYIDKLPREWERPSDHVPVIAEWVV